MIDPWPGVDGVAKDREQGPARCSSSRTSDRGLHALDYFWSGWS